METFKLPMGEAVDLLWPEPQAVVFAYVWQGEIHGVRRTHPEEEPDSVLEREASRIKREHRAGLNVDKQRKRGV